MLSMHPHAIAANGEDCLYMQDTWLVTADGGVPLAGLPMEIVACDDRLGGRARPERGRRHPLLVGRRRRPRLPRLPRRRVGDCPSPTTSGCSRSSRSRGSSPGLSWLTILRKREAFRRAFAGFDFRAVARFGERDVERLLGDASIVRHRGKIESTINNARRAIELVEAEGSLAAFVWRFEPRPARRARDA